MLRSTTLMMFLVAGLGVPASAQVRLERKMQEGASHGLELTSKTEQTLVIAGMNTETKAESRTKARSAVGTRDAAGRLKVEEKIESLQINITVMGSEYSFDSANPDNTGGSVLEVLRPVHKIVSKGVTTTVYDKDNKVAQVEIDQTALGNLPEEVRNLVKSQFDPERLKRAANAELDRIPAEAVKQGDTWERTEKLDLGSGQVMNVTTRYTYEGEIEKDGRKLDKITSKALSLDFGLEDSPLPFTVKSSDLKPTESKGEILFDRERGQTVETSSAVRIEGDIVFVINNMELPSQLDLKIDVASRRTE